MVLNLDQTPVKYILSGKTTLAKQNTSSAPVSGVSDKQMITAIFTITLDGKFLRVQLIYSGKTRKGILTVKFPREFLLSANLKCYSNEKGTLKLLRKVTVLYVQNKRKTLCLDADYLAFLIMDVFKGQMTPVVLNMLKANSICLTKVLANMTNFYQLLDVIVNDYAKLFMKRMFMEWFASKICEVLESGKAPEEIDIKMSLSVLKPLQAGCIIKLYNKMTSLHGENVILKGWEKLLSMGTAGLPSLDPFDKADVIVRGRK